MNNIVPESTYDGDQFNEDDFKSLIASEIQSGSVEPVNTDDEGNLITRTNDKPNVSRLDNDDQITVQREYKPTTSTNKTFDPQTTQGVTNQGKELEIPEDTLYQAAFDFLKESQLLEVPDDMTEFNEESFQWLIDANRQKMYGEVLEDIVSRAGDDYVAELYKMVHNGGTLDDVKRLFDVQESSRNLELYDVKNVAHQRDLIKLYLQEGLNPRIPSHVKRLENIDEEVQRYIDKGEGVNTAIEAKEYFDEKHRNIAETERKKIEERKLREERAAIMKLKKEREWIENFKNTLDRRTWSTEKKDKVIEQFNKVKLTDGTEKLLWQYKMDRIWESPELTQHLMDFLGEFDEYKLEFKNRDNTIQEKISKKLSSIIKNNTNRSKSNAAEYHRGRDSAANQTIDPTQNI